MTRLVPDPSVLPELTPAPLWQRLTLEDPIPLAAALLVVTLVAGFLTFRKGKAVPAAAVVALGSVVVTSLLFVARQVVTITEALADRTADLVADTGAANIPAVERALFEEVRVTGLPLAEFESRAAVLAAIDRFVGSTYRVQEIDAVEVRVGLDNPSQARAQVRVRALPAGWDRPSMSWWEITWRQDPGLESPENTPAGDWVVTRIEALWIQGVG